MDTIQNMAGCDSIITLDLTINQADASVTQSGNTLTANAVGASYRWLDCDDNFSAISGESSMQFIPMASGNYSAEVTENGCVDTSDCINITVVGLGENQLDHEFEVYPNPVKRYIDIEEHNKCGN